MALVAFYSEGTDCREMMRPCVGAASGVECMIDPVGLLCTFELAVEFRLTVGVGALG